MRKRGKYTADGFFFFFGEFLKVNILETTDVCVE